MQVNQKGENMQENLIKLHSIILDGDLTEAAKLCDELVAAAQQGVQQIQANCYSNDDGDYWRDCPDDCDFVEGLKVGDTFELQASIRAWSETYRVTKAPDDTSDDYEVELVSSDAPIATTPQPPEEASTTKHQGESDGE